jgi:myo-inositol-1(or 4)-monophosphatase
MQEIGQKELENIYHFAIQLGKDAGKILLQGLEKRRVAGDSGSDDMEKINAVDIVTQTDNGELVCSVPVVG